LFFWVASFTATIQAMSRTDDSSGLTNTELERIRELGVRLKTLGVPPTRVLARAADAEDRMRALVPKNVAGAPGTLSSSTLVGLVAVLPSWSEETGEEGDVLMAPSLLGAIVGLRQRVQTDPLALRRLKAIGAVLDGKRPKGRVGDFVKRAQARMDYGIFLRIRDLFHERAGLSWQPKAREDPRLPWHTFDGSAFDPIFTDQVERFLEARKRRNAGHRMRGVPSASQRSALVFLAFLRKRKGKRATVADHDVDEALAEVDKVKKLATRRSKL